MADSQPVYIFGPCSAESREQVLLSARLIQEACGNTPFIFRAGAWKPRTSPYSFQGAGAQGLAWLQEVKALYGLPVATEVATTEHVKEAADKGIDYLWIGARTSANPIAVQALAEAIRQQQTDGVHTIRGVLIKNPVNADAALWIGNIERLEQTGVPVMAVHRGCGHQPCWFMAHAVHQAKPEIPLLLDPSHMSGNAESVPSLAYKATELGYNGMMVEIHPHPEQALSDAGQQVSPESTPCLLEPFMNYPGESDGHEELRWLRAEIDELDDRLWETIVARMDVSRRIGTWKKAHGVAPLQPERYQQLLQQRQSWAETRHLDADFVEQVLSRLHSESLKQQE